MGSLRPNDQMEICYLSLSPEGVLTPCTVVEAETLMANEESRVLARNEIDGGFVSTAFLPICMTFEDGSPQAFETVVIRGHRSQVVKRYADLAEALRGHDETAASLSRS